MESLQDMSCVYEVTISVKSSQIFDEDKRVYLSAAGLTSAKKRQCVCTLLLSSVASETEKGNFITLKMPHFCT